MRFWLLVLVFAAGLAVGLCLRPGPGTPGARTDPDAAEAAEADDDRARTIRVGGRRAVVLTEVERELAGIRTVIAVRETAVPERLAFATVMDDASLVAMVTQRRALADELALQRGLETELAQRIARLGPDVASGAERTRLNADLQRVRRERVRLEGALAEASLALRREVGELTGQLKDGAPLIDALERGQQRLLRLRLPLGERMPAGTGFVFVAPDGRRDAARKAYVLGAAPLAPGELPAAAYFLRMEAPDLQPGMLADAYVPLPDRAVAGVALPRSAVVWYAGGRWCYLEQDDGTFVRTRVAAAAEFGSRLVVDAGIAPGDRVVATGAEVLLAEEFRARIPEEDDD